MLWLAAAVGLYLGPMLCGWPGELSLQGRLVLGASVAGMILWMSEALPLGLVALIVVVLLGAVPGLGTATVFWGFASPVVFFLLGAFAIGAAVQRTGIADKAARLLTRGAGGSPARLYGHMLLGLPLLAFVLPSAITRNAILIPAYEKTLTTMGVEGSPRAGRATMLALGVLHPLASSALLTGGIASMTTASLVGGFTWGRWFLVMAIPYYCLFFVGAAVLWAFVGGFERGRAVAPPALARPSAPEWRTLAIVVLISAAWFTDGWHHVSPAIPALAGAALLIAPRIGVLNWKDFETGVAWGTILTVGASLSVARALQDTGAAPWLGRGLSRVMTALGVRGTVALVVVVIAVAVIHLLITNLAACIALLVPVAMSVAAEAGLNPIVFALTVTIVIDAVILYPVQTATNLLAYEAGYFRAADVWRFGLIVLGLTIVLLLGVILPYWRLLGLPLAR